uniref:Pentatricopeptide repeat-containing protein 1 n=1 Tax=Lygus hesperus TaxID=30085 RepID=A0A0A9W814_LYGHE
MLQAACVHDDYDKAFQLFDEMKRMGLLPDLLTYNILLTICQQRIHYVFGTGRYSGIHRLPEQVRQGKHTLAELVMCLVSEMKALCIALNTYTYHTVLFVLLKCDDYRLFTVYRDAVSAYPSHLKSANIRKGNTTISVETTALSNLGQESVKV